jgi:polygalacturonase
MRRRELLAIAGITLASRPFAESKPAAVGRVFNVRDYGAAGDGKTKDTEAIRRAVDECAKAGGGTVYLPPGTYLSGTVVLKENVTFELEGGATLLGSTNLADYPPQSGPPLTGDANAKHLLFARDAANVTVCGSGKIDGQGRAFWAPSNRPQPKPEDAWRDVATYDWKPLDRPSPMVEFFNCSNLRIENVTLANSSGWTLRPVECETVFISGVKIRNPVIGPNTDGIDPTCCRNVFIADCDIKTGDDAICLKSESPYGKMGVTKNITITNCALTCCCNGLKFGTATRGGFENVTFSNSVIYNEDAPLNARVISGIAIEMVDGGWVEGVVVSNIRMQRVRTPIFIRLGNRGGGQRAPTPGRLRGVSINNVHATGAILTSSITGLPGHDVEDVALTDIRIETEEGGKAAWIGDVPEVAASYPEARMFGRLPAWGFYCRHVRGLKLDNVRLAAAAPDERPAIHCEDAKELRVDRIDAPASASSQPLIRLVNVQGGLLTGCAAPAGAAVAVEISGATATEIRAVGNDFSRAQRAFEFRDGAPANTLTEADNLLPKQ